MKYSPLLTLMALVFASNLHAQCLSGNCENGTGELRIRNNTYDGIYKGECKQGMATGKGIFAGKVKIPHYTINITEEGKYVDGYCISGKRRFENGSVEPYPIINVNDYTQKNGKGKVVKKWKETSLAYSMGKYSGDLKNDMASGKGLYQEDRFSFTGTFANGIPVQIDSARKSVHAGLVENVLYANYENYRYQNIVIEGDLITKMEITDGRNAKFILLKPKSLMEWMFGGDDNGFYEVRYPNGVVYTGMINNFKWNGSGLTKMPDGGIMKGSYVDGIAHGLFSTRIKDYVDSGLYIRGQLFRGTVFFNSQNHEYPLCVSGNCSNGTGKISYWFTNNDSVHKTYQGGLVDQLPGGYGVMEELNGKMRKVKTGNFLQGVLYGFANYEGNAGIVTKMTGTFEADTLKEGTVTYRDGASFQFTRQDYDYLMAPASFGEKKATLVSSVDKKVINGNGTYRTAAGAVVTGKWRNALLFEGIYADVSGNKILLNGDIAVDDLDARGKQIIAAIRADEEKKKREAAAYAMEKERQARYAEAAKDPKNFTEESRTIKCTACNGTGYILSGYSVGSISYVSQEYMDGSGNWRRDLKGFVPAHNVTSRTACEACRKSGVVRVNQRKYVGPKF